MSSGNERFAVLVLCAASITWGTTWWPLKQVAALGVHGLPQLLVAYGSMAILLLPFAWLARGSLATDARALAGIFVLGGAANLCFAWAFAHGEVVRVMALFYLLPVWGVLGGRIFLGEKIDAMRALTVVLALSGAFLVLGGPAVLQTSPSTVDVVAIASGFFFAMNNLCFRASQSAPVTAKVAIMFTGCATLATLMIAAGVDSMPSGVTASTWLLVVGVGVLLLAATMGSQYGVTHLEAGRASVIIILELVSAVVTAAWWGGESLAVMGWVGGAMILSAAVLEARRAS